MNRRLYFILLTRIDEQRMHFPGINGTKLGDLPEATSEQRTDLLVLQHHLEVEDHGIELIKPDFPKVSFSIYFIITI